jgi:hypothetical protein
MKKRIILSRFLLATVLTLSTSFNAYSHDLFGSDIAGLNVTNANECNNACNANANCLAWTFVKAGRLGPSARCFLKNPVPGPSFNATCPTDAECVSGSKRFDGWCGDGQGDVLSCPAGLTCRPKTIMREQVCWIWFLWIPYPCHFEEQTTDLFCV